jgi:hypothetical protein
LTLVQPDRLRAIADSVLSADVYRWEDVSDPWAPVKRIWQLVVAWIERLREQNPAAYRILFWGLVVVLVAIVAHALWLAARTMYGGATRTPTGAALTRVVARDAVWYGREAERLAHTGQYAEAMQYDFARLMLELDARKIASFHPSKTPGDYAREVRLPAAQRNELRGLVNTIYAHAYAGVHADAATWAQWRRRTSMEHYAAAN